MYVRMSLVIFGTDRCFCHIFVTKKPNLLDISKTIYWEMKAIFDCEKVRIEHEITTRGRFRTRATQFSDLSYLIIFAFVFEGAWLKSEKSDRGTTYRCIYRTKTLFLPFYQLTNRLIPTSFY